MNTFWKWMKRILISILLLFIAVNILWQYEYEAAISDIRKRCSFFDNRKRLRHTPLLFYYIHCYYNRTEMKRDRILRTVLSNTCSFRDIGTGSSAPVDFMAHEFLTATEEDSISAAYGVDWKNYHFHKH